MSKPTILTGLRANSDLHLGNYFGAMLPMVKMATEKAGDYQINLFVPDLHSFTTPIDHSQLKNQIHTNIMNFVAAGLPIDNSDVHIYRQSHVPAHSELTWILDCFTGMGEMNRMTQFKDKSASLNDDRISVGLFNYPVLMAADILLYDAEYVPVGDDQSQHLEFTRDIADRINKRFNQEIFVVPKAVSEQHKFFGKEQGLRIKDLSDPSKKMSKSDETGKGVIFLSDTPEAAHKKVMSAATDSETEIKYDPVAKPGISNLLEILALLKDEDVQSTAAQFEDAKSYGDFKKVVADEVANFLAKYQKALNAVEQNEVLDKLQSSEEAMRLQSTQTLTRVQKAIGLR